MEQLLLTITDANNVTDQYGIKLGFNKFMLLFVEH